MLIYFSDFFFFFNKFGLKPLYFLCWVTLIWGMCFLGS